MTYNNNLLPVCGAETIKSYRLFLRALTFQKRITAQNKRTSDNDAIVKAAKLYQKAFDKGLLEAGINLLNILVPAMLTNQEKSPNAPAPFQDRVLSCIEILENAGNPAGSFYRAFCLIYDLLDTGDSSESNWEKGLALMDGLSVGGYRPAAKYIDWLYAEGCED